MGRTAFQDQIGDNYCFGCGPTIEQGLRIKSYWDGPDETICTYQPESHQAAGPKQFLNGGVIATLIDCHCICTAIAFAYRGEGREIGSSPAIWYATGSLTVKYSRPTPIEVPVVLRASVIELGEKKSVLSCTLSSSEQECATGEVIAIRVPLSWRDAK